MEHGLDLEVIVVFALTVVAWSLASARSGAAEPDPRHRLRRDRNAGRATHRCRLVDIAPASETVRTLTEITLAVVLFADAARIDFRRLRHRAAVPTRLLALGLPLTVLAGLAIGLVLFDGLSVWLCAVIAASVAPTDAALGAPLMVDERIPGEVRQALNVESGLNDGLVTPLVTFFVAAAAAEAGERPELSLSGAVADLAIGAGVGVLVGIAAGLLLALAQRRSWIVRGAAPLFTLAVALLSYAAGAPARRQRVRRRLRRRARLRRRPPRRRRRTRVHRRNR